MHCRSSRRKTHKDKHTQTFFPPHSKTNIFSLHYTCKLYLSPHPPFFVPVHLFLLYFFHFAHSTLSLYLSTMCSYLFLHLLPSQNSPAKGLCPFIIHGVVLMAQAAMSDVNLCASKAHWAYTASARRVTAWATVLRYHTGPNQQAQSHLKHPAHANYLLLFRLAHSIPPLFWQSIWYAFMHRKLGLGKNLIIRFITCQQNCIVRIRLRYVIITQIGKFSLTLIRR